MEELDSQSGLGLSGRDGCEGWEVGGGGGSWSGGSDELLQSLMVLGEKIIVSVVCSTGDSFEVYLYLSSSGSGWWLLQATTCLTPSLP